SDRDNRTGNHPSFGSVISRMRGGADSKTPPFISLRGMTRGTEPGFVGIAHRPFSPSGAGANSLRLSRGMTVDRLQDRKGLLSSFGGMRREVDHSGTLDGMNSFKTRALDMVLSGSVRDALDLSKATADERKRYKGVEQFLTARRLVEAGAGCVTLAIGGWDTPGGNFNHLQPQVADAETSVRDP